jgi:hypothetical protein
MFSRLVLYPFLFAIFPALFLFAQNAEQMTVSHVVLPLAIVLVATAAMMGLVWMITRDLAKSGIITSLFMLLFFSFGRIIDPFRGLYIPIGNTDIGVGQGVTAALALIWLAATGIIFLAKVDFGKITKALNVIAFLLVALQVVMAGVVLGQRLSAASERREAPVDITVPEDPPDIYYIILDGYGREDVLRNTLECDDLLLYDSLRSAGFYIAPKSNSNYIMTIFSVTSCLNMQYVQDFDDYRPDLYDLWAFSSHLKENRLFEILRATGYSLVTFRNGFQLTDDWDTDVRLNPGLVFSDYQNHLLNSTPIPSFLVKNKNQFDIHRDRITYQLTKLARINEASKPMFVFAHVLAPHPPFVFGPDGEPVQRDWPLFSMADGGDWRGKWGRPEEYVDGYCKQVRHVSRLMWESIKRILADAGDNPPIIIIQGDHGPGSRLDRRTPDNSDYQERFGILNAFYLPGFDTTLIDPDITTVNTFRMILNGYFGTGYELLPNRHYFTLRVRKFDFLDKTEHLVPRFEVDSSSE